MERISKALELARAQQHRAFDAASAPLAGSSSAADTPPAGISGEPQFSDTLMFRSPVMQTSPEHLESERILAPGANGEVGGAYKMLRTQVLKRLDQLGVNSVAVLSPTAGAGKTLTAINLAIAIAAETNRTALLVDLDLRNPSVHKRFGIRPERGIDECLNQRRPVQEAMVKIAGYERLTLLPALARVPHSSELLSDLYTAEVMAEMRTRYANRIIIIDLPPVLQADDALAFTRLMQAGLLVVGEGKSRRDDVSRTIQLLHDTPIVGTVLNGSRDVTDGYY